MNRPDNWFAAAYKADLHIALANGDELTSEQATLFAEWKNEWKTDSRAACITDICGIWHDIDSVAEFLQCVNRKRLLSRLKLLRKGGPVWDNVGVCGHVDGSIDVLVYLLCKNVYPIEGSAVAYRENQEKWKGKWRRKRMRLLGRLIKTLQ